MTEEIRKQDKEQGIDDERRSFIRKAGYVAPALVVLGVTAHSSPARAQLGGSGPPDPPPPVSAEDELLQDLEEIEKSKR